MVNERRSACSEADLAMWVYPITSYDSFDTALDPHIDLAIPS